MKRGDLDGAARSLAPRVQSLQRVEVGILLLFLAGFRDQEMLPHLLPLSIVESAFEFESDPVLRDQKWAFRFVVDEEDDDDLPHARYARTSTELRLLDVDFCDIGPLLVELQ